MDIPGYSVIQEVARNDLCALYRGRSEREATPVLLKVPLQATGRAALAQECELLRGLELNGVARVVELLGDGEGLVLADGGGWPVREHLNPYQLNLDLFFTLAGKFAGLLAELHQREIVLNRLTPESVLFNAETGEVCLVDLSFATRNAAETQALRLPLLAARTLRYLSPEQTRRMNRPIDYRTDFYSLGVIFYEWLTGNPPFDSDDALELIHAHIAKTPVSPAVANPLLPRPLAEIVEKLLAKTAGQRYQSASGLQTDLATCALQWARHHSLTPFPLGREDVSDRFNIPQSLYGRAAEVQELLDAFARVCEGASAVLLVAGYSGIGKTSLIHELHRPVVAKNGYFITGKFDQVARGTPFGALIQAFRGFARQLLTESDARLSLWRQRLTAALGANGGVLAEVIPEIELVIGRQTPPPKLGPTETLNRFQLVFQNFVGAVAQPAHPLVLFLDDLQWADPATLGLLQPLLTSSGLSHFLLLGAYRDNEVDAAHPLAHTLGLLEASGWQLQRLALNAIEPTEVARFVADTLQRPAAEIEPLARLVQAKTAGNPFFAIQFLQTLKQENLLVFDYRQRHWAYRLEEISAAAITDNVVDLMTRKIRTLSPRAQHLLTLAACIGSSFDEQTLAVVSEQRPETVAAGLREAIRAGLLAPALRHYETAVGPAAQTTPAVAAYSFIHDRIQQAAYLLIPLEQNQAVHLAVGRLLLAATGREQLDEKSFETVNHLNLGRELITDAGELLALARLNLAAGRKAKSATAFAAALDYFNAGVSLLGEDHWGHEYELAFALRLEATECRYLRGQFDETEELFVFLRERARTALDKAKVFNLQMLQYENQARYAESIAVARENLAQFGVSFPDGAEAKLAALENEIATIQTLLDGRSIASLISLPELRDPATQMVLHILTDIWSATYITGDAVLARLISATMVRLSLLQGNIAESAYGYVTHAITVGPALGDYQAAYEFGRLALAVNERFQDTRRRAKIHQQFHAHVNLWRQPLATCLPHAREACRSGLEAGDFLYAAYGAHTETWAALPVAQDLARFVRDYTPNLSLIQQLKVNSFADAHQLMLHWARALQGQTDAPASLSSADFDEEQYAATYRDNPFFTMFLATARMQLGYLFGDAARAAQAERQARGIVQHLAGTIWPALYDFWSGLILTDCGLQSLDCGLLNELEAAQGRLAVLAENCPANYLCYSLLLAAELERVRGHELAALELYEQAVAHANETKLLQHQALAHEIYAKFWQRRGQEMLAALFFSEATRHYAACGASAKVADLTEKYAGWHGWQNPARDAAPDALQLDVVSVTKAAQAITGEIEFEKLLAKLLLIALENAGAEHGCLLLVEDGELLVYAAGSADAVELHLPGGLPLAQAGQVARSVIHYARRTLESVVLEDAGNDPQYGNDPDIARRRPLSLMCVPVVRQGRVQGLLYLENNAAAAVFTPERARLCQILAAQAAVSLENARLYEEMKAEAAQRRQAEETLRSIMLGTAAVTGDNFLASMVRHLADVMQARYAFVTECRDFPQLGGQAEARMLVFWKGGDLAENVSYQLADTPCLNVFAGQTCYYPRGVRQLFPHDRDLAELNAEGYLGVPLYAATGQIVGHLAVLDDKPLVHTANSESLIRIFAARAGAELERLHADEELRRALAQVEQLKNRLQAENLYLQEEIRREHNFEEIVGNSPALLQVLHQVERIAPTDATVLILGETGTGKELIARALHNRSNRARRPLVKVNCGAISAGLVESELFGHVKGAFTGALDKRAGRFELADGGTLFLDEVGELPPEMQVKLLRVLQEGEFEPVGGSRTVRVDVRIIAATNRHLENAVREGRFRADLYYRLNVLPLNLPSLRERREDIPQLAVFFAERYARKFSKQIEGIAQETMALLANYGWPGNVRELQNIIERGVVLAQGRTLTLDPNLLPAAAPTFKATVPPPVHAPAPAATFDDAQRQHILAVLQQTNWLIEGDQGAAKILNLHPNTLRSRLKKLGLKRPARNAF